MGLFDLFRKKTPLEVSNNRPKSKPAKTIQTSHKPDNPAMRSSSQQMGPKNPPSGLASELLSADSVGDDAVESVLRLAENGDSEALRFVEDALEVLAGKKLSYLTIGPRVMEGDDLSIHAIKFRILQKALGKQMLDDAKDTQNDVMLLFNNYPSAEFMRSLLWELNAAGGPTATKTFQLLLTHAQVQARLAKYNEP